MQTITAPPEVFQQLHQQAEFLSLLIIAGSFTLFWLERFWRLQVQADWRQLRRGNRAAALALGGQLSGWVVAWLPFWWYGPSGRALPVLALLLATLLQVQGQMLLRWYLQPRWRERLLQGDWLAGGQLGLAAVLLGELTRQLLTLLPQWSPVVQQGWLF